VALLAVSYSLIYSILRFINFTFGEVLMLAAYAFYTFKAHLGLPTWLAGSATVILLGVAGALVQVGAYKPFYRRSRLACLITALGVSLVLQNVALMWVEGRPLSLREQIPTTILQFGGVAVTYIQFKIFLAAVGLLVLTDLVVFRSGLGLRLRALADNLPMAEIIGVHVNRTIAAVFVLGSCFAATAGVLLSFEHVLKPTMGMSPGIQAFAACVVGGIGSIRGAVVAAFIVAGLSHFMSFKWPLITPETTAYTALLLALTLLPEGLAALSHHARWRGFLRLCDAEAKSDVEIGRRA
jgi:branched-chain amino acid transport system permease protein